MPEQLHGLTLVTQPHPIRTEGRQITVMAAGGTVAEIMAAAGLPPSQPGGGGDGAPRWIAWVDGVRIPDDQVDVVRPGATSFVVGRAIAAGGGGGGGKSGGRIAAMVALLALTLVTGGAGGALGAAGLFNVGVTGVGASAALTTTGVLFNAFAAAAVSIAGNLAINALMPLPGPSSGSSLSTRANPLLTGTRNTARPYDSLPRVYGRHRIYPDLGATVWTELSGGKSYLRLIFCFGRGPLEFTDMRIGDTPILREGTAITYTGVMVADGPFKGLELEVRQGTDSDAATTLYPGDVRLEPLQIELRGRAEVAAPKVSGPGGKVTYGTPATQGKPDVERAAIRRTEMSTDEISIDLFFPAGLIFTSASGSTSPVTVKVQIQYRLVGATNWTAAPLDAADSAGRVEITAEKPEPLTRGFRWQVTRGQYDVSVTRITPEAADSGRQDRVYWTMLRSIQKGVQMVPTGVAHVVMRIRATNQLSGTIDSFSAICTSRLPVWNGSAWVEAATSNPAAIYRHILQGDDTARPAPDAQVDLTTLQSAVTRCASDHRECNVVFEGEGTVLERLRLVAATMRASFHIRDGKYSLLFDDEQVTPRQLFNSRNSRGLRGVKMYPDLPHALKVRFRDPKLDFEIAEEIVYDDGYSATGAGGTTAATKFEDAEFVGFTNPAIVWKDARYHMAVARLRDEQYEIETDFEHLVCTRGDLVRLAHDVLERGIAASRVKLVEVDGGGACTHVTIEGTALLETAVSYGVVVRKSSGTLAQIARQVVTVVGEQSRLEFSTPIASGDPHPVAGDLLVVGVLGLETIDCLVKTIEPIEDLAARLTLIPEEDAVYDADTGTRPSWAEDRIAGDVEPNSRAPSDTPPAPTVLSVSSSTGAPRNDTVSTTPAETTQVAAPAAPQASTATLLIQVAPKEGKKKPKKNKGGKK